MEGVEPQRWPRYVLVLLGVAVIAATAWSKGWLHPLVERALGETPQARVAAYLDAVRRGDGDAALACWPSSGGQQGAALEDRRQAVTGALLAMEPGLRYTIVAVDWWSNCCDPHPARRPAEAGVARMRVEVTDGQGEAQDYVFDVVAAGGAYWADAAHYPVRRWQLRDVYTAQERPLAFPYPAATTADTPSLPVSAPAATSTPVPSATPAPCLEGEPAPAPTPAGALRIDYWSEGRLWEWAEESGVAVPFPLPEDAAAARISADGEWIAYQRVLDERRSELWAVRADGTDPRLLATVDAAETYARYSYLTGTHLGFDWVQGTHTVAFLLQPQFEGLGQLPYEAVRLVDAETGAVRQVIPAGEVWHLVYAPDGGQLAALTKDELRLVDARDGRVQHRYQVPLTCGPWQSLAYSPDGRYLAVFHLAGIAIIDAHDGTRRDIPFVWKPIGMGEYCVTPPILWLDDAPAFYTAVGKGETPDELLAPSSTFTIWRIDAREAAATALHTFTGSVLSAQFSPDNRRVAYWVQERDGTRHLYLADVESGRQVLYISGTAESILVFLGWNPDSARFVIKASDLELGQICGAPVPLKGVAARNGLTRVDAERFMAFGCDDSYERCDVSLHTLGGGVEPVATLTGAHYYSIRFEAPRAAGGPAVAVSRLERIEDLCCPPVFAPHGEGYLTIREGKLLLHSLAGGAVKELLDGVGDAAWTPDGRGIVWVHGAPSGMPATVEILDLATGESRALGDTYVPWRLTFDARGRLILATETAFRAVDVASGDWMELPQIAVGDVSGEHTELAFSPDRRYVAALEGQQLSIVDLNQAAKTLVTDRIHRRRWAAFAWSEDGEHLAYSIAPERGAPPELWVVHADGSGARRIVARPEGYGGAFAGLTWLPGTPYIVYEYVPDSNIATLQAEYQVVSAAGGPPKTLFGNGLGLTLSPDGRIVSFVRDLEGEEEMGSWIAVLDCEGAGGQD